MNNKLAALIAILVVSAVSFMIWKLHQMKYPELRNTTATTDTETRKNLAGHPSVASNESAPVTPSHVDNAPMNRRGLTVSDKRAMAERMRSEEDHLRSITISVVQVKYNGASHPYPSGAKASKNQDGTMVIKEDDTSFRIFSSSGELVKKLPCEYGLDPENGLIGEGVILWEWLDTTRVIGVQEAWNERDPDPMAGVNLGNSESTVTAPTRASVLVYNTQTPNSMYKLEIADIPKGFAVRVDGIGENGCVEVSACTPLAYHKVTKETWDESTRHNYTKHLGWYSVPLQK